MTSRQRRALRGALAASSATLVAACAHTLGGGGAPPLALLLVVAVLATPLAVVLVGRVRSLARLAAAVVAAQVLFHAAFALVGTLSAPAGGSPADAAALEHAAHGMPLLGAHDAAIAWPPSIGMIAAHVAAAVVTTLLVRRGEQAASAVAAGLRELLGLRPLALPTGLRPAAAGAVAPDARGFAVPIRFASVVSRRGPPAA